jgi:glycosyltransferase involved in cell wall biosynthesis
MKIAIIGTRGIPNHYGGFEQFAEYLSVGLVKKGHAVTVYNSHSHPHKESTWNKVQIIHCLDPEDKIGTAGQFIYDFNCILDSRKRNFDAILQLGYTSSSIWSKLLPKKPTIFTNMDGLEWKRTKFSSRVQRFLLQAEKWAVNSSDHLIADSLGIKDYLKKKYDVQSTYIPYGATPFNNPSSETLLEYGLNKYSYNMLIARLEPENSIEIILDGAAKSNSSFPFLVIGNHQTQYGEFLKAKFADQKNVIFLGGVYDINKLNNLRHYSNLYFHGHTVGGTNPSLLEAMASSALVCAHHNSFNKYILEEDAYYFTTSSEVTNLIQRVQKEKVEEQSKVSHNIEKVNLKYNWQKVIDEYENLLLNGQSK